MPQIDASGLSFGFDAFSANEVAFVPGAATPFSYVWTNPENIRVTAISHLGDITTGLAGTVHAISIRRVDPGPVVVPGLSITGLNAPLLSLIDTSDVALNHRKFWSTALAGETEIFLPTTGNALNLMGDFVTVLTGQSLTGSADTFRGVVGLPISTMVLVGDAVSVAAGATLQGGNDQFLDALTSDALIGDVGGSGLIQSAGTVFGGDDLFTLVNPVPTFGLPVGQIIGDVDFMSQPGFVFGGEDTITVSGFLTIGAISGDVRDSEAGMTGGNDTILVTGEITVSPMMISEIAGDLLSGNGVVNGNGVQRATGGNDTITTVNASGSRISGDFGSMGSFAVTGGNDTILVDAPIWRLPPNPFQPRPTLFVNEIVGDGSFQNLAAGSSNSGGDDSITVRETNFGTLSGDFASVVQTGGSFTGGDDTISITYAAVGQSLSATVLGDALGHTIEATPTFINASIDYGDDTITVDTRGSSGGTMFLFGDVTAFTPSGPGPSVTAVFGNDVIRLDAAPNQSSVITGDADSLFLPGGVTGIITYGHDTLTGGDGADTIHGDVNNEGLDGLAIGTITGGNDILDGRGGNDRLFGGRGVDTASFASLAQAVVVFLEGIPGGDPSDPVDAMGQGLDRLFEIENIIGSSMGDIIVGDALANALDGGGGDDALVGGDGNDTLTGGSGTDRMSGGLNDDRYVVTMATTGIDTVSEVGGGGNDTVQVTDQTAAAMTYRRSANDLVIERPAGGQLILEGHFAGDPLQRVEFLLTTDQQRFLRADLVGTSSSEIITGSSAADLIEGQGGNDILSGGSGNDTLRGGTGIDNLRGGLDNDTYRFAFAIDGESLISEQNGGGGTDTLSVLDRAATALTFRRSATNLVIEETGSTARVVIEGMFSGSATDRVEQFSGTDGLRFMQTGLTGSGQGDILVGGSGNEVLSGEGGNDILWAGGGNDTLLGGAGNDRLLGGTGNDLYEFTFATDNEIRVSEIDGGGTDTLDISDASAVELGFRRSSNLLVIERAGTTARVVIEDHFSGVATNRIEQLDATDGLRFLKSELVGTATADILVGASGAETLNGAGGNDIIAGGGAKDVLTGGLGADVFTYNAISDSTVTAAGRDTIMDFSQAQGDRINLRMIDANTGVAGDQAFSFVGLGPTTGAGTLGFTHLSGNTLIQADVDGGGPDFAILLAGVHTLVPGDFLL